MGCRNNFFNLFSDTINKTWFVACVRGSFRKQNKCEKLVKILWLVNLIATFLYILKKKHIPGFVENILEEFFLTHCIYHSNAILLFTKPYCLFNCCFLHLLLPFIIAIYLHWSFPLWVICEEIFTSRSYSHPICSFFVF